MIPSVEIAVMMASADPESAVLKFIGVMGCAGVSPFNKHTISRINEALDDLDQDCL